MGEHLGKLQMEEAELLSGMIAQRLTKAALEILKMLGIIQERVEDDADLDPEEAEMLRAAEALARRHFR